MSLPDEIVNMICRYNSHPVADIIRTSKQNLGGISFPREILFCNRVLFKNKVNDRKNFKKKQDKQFNEKINKIYLFLDFCKDSFIFLGIYLFLLYYVFEAKYILLVLPISYFYFYFISLIFLIYFSLNISTEE